MQLSLEWEFITSPVSYARFWLHTCKSWKTFHTSHRCSSRSLESISPRSQLLKYWHHAQMTTPIFDRGKIRWKFPIIIFWHNLVRLPTKSTYFCTRNRFLAIFLGLHLNLTRYDHTHTLTRGKIWRKLWNLEFWQILTCLLSKPTYFCTRNRFLAMFLGLH